MIDLNLVDGDNNTCVHLACQVGSRSILTFLFYHGAKIVCRNKEGKLPDAVAIDNNHQDIADFFHDVISCSATIQSLEFFKVKHSSDVDVEWSFAPQPNFYPHVTALELQIKQNKFFDSWKTVSMLKASERPATASDAASMALTAIQFDPKCEDTQPDEEVEALVARNSGRFVTREPPAQYVAPACSFRLSDLASGQSYVLRGHCASKYGWGPFVSAPVEPVRRKKEKKEEEVREESAGKVEEKEEVAPEPVTAPAPAPVPAPEPVLESVPVPEPVPAPEPVSQPAPQPTPGTEPKPEPEPESTPAPEPAKLEPTPAPTEPEPKPESKPEPKPEPASKPEPKPEPTPVPKQEEPAPDAPKKRTRRKKRRVAKKVESSSEEESSSDSDSDDSDSDSDDTPLMQELLQGGVARINKALEEGVALKELHNPQGDSLLHLAAGAGQDDIIRLLVKEGKMSVNQRNQQSITPMHQAVFGDHVSTVKLLSELGASVEARDTVFVFVSSDP